MKGLYYFKNYISHKEKDQIIQYLKTITPLWENRYASSDSKKLLRPVYWLGNWQFACLNYYHPPKGVLNRCLKAEPYPPVLKTILSKIETYVRKNFHFSEVPKNWHLNTCLINLYGNHFNGKKWVDTARVGEHRDFEPGPVASISFGERAFFQFVSSYSRGMRSQVVLNQWLEDCSLQIFGGRKWKDSLFHRVQRVEKKNKSFFDMQIKDFQTRRINFTFRYVPDEHIKNFKDFPNSEKEKIINYLEKLSESSNFFKEELVKGTI